MIKSHTEHVYKTVTLERRWFKDPPEFDFICKQLSIEPSLIGAIDTIEIGVDRVDFETEEDDDEDA